MKRKKEKKRKKDKSSPIQLSKVSAKTECKVCVFPLLRIRQSVKSEWNDFD